MEWIRKHDMASGPYQADDKAGKPKIEYLGAAVEDIDHRGHAAENAAEIVEKCV